MPGMLARFTWLSSVPLCTTGIFSTLKYMIIISNHFSLILSYSAVFSKQLSQSLNNKNEQRGEEGGQFSLFKMLPNAAIYQNQ